MKENKKLTVYVLNTERIKEIGEDLCREHFPWRYDRSLRFRFEADRLRSLAAGYLIWSVLAVEEGELVKGDKGKLYLKAQCHKAGQPLNGKILDFNVSHSGSFAVLAAAEDMVGVDIEQIDPKHLGVAKRVFTAEEQAWMKEEDGQTAERFFTLWTLKEAASKALGKGLSIDARSFSVLPLIGGGRIQLEGAWLYGATTFLEDCALSVVTGQKVDGICIEFK